jgi:glycosyltransferase involved in cell wall biosynthesis
MPRVGRHPLKIRGLEERALKAPLTVATVVHIPALEGYWVQSLEVLRLFVASLLATTPRPFDLMVLDNGSCTEVADYLLELRDRQVIQLLVLSQRNLRKTGAMAFLLGAAPGDLVAFADSDALFLPGWLERSLEVLQAFPEAGKVSALPVVRGDRTRVQAFALEAARADPETVVRTGELIAPEVVDAHRRSLGESPEQYGVRYRDRVDVLFERRGVGAYLVGTDFQFTITRRALDAVLPLRLEDSVEPYDPIYSPVLERRLLERRFWQLSTADYLVHHMGNRPPDIASELPWLDDAGLQVGNLTPLAPPAGRGWLRSHSRVRRLLRWVNLASYRWLYD